MPTFDGVNTRGTIKLTPRLYCKMHNNDNKIGHNSNMIGVKVKELIRLLELNHVTMLYSIAKW